MKEGLEAGLLIDYVPNFVVPLFWSWLPLFLSDAFSLPATEEAMQILAKT